MKLSTIEKLKIAGISLGIAFGGMVLVASVIEYTRALQEATISTTSQDTRSVDFTCIDEGRPLLEAYNVEVSRVMGQPDMWRLDSAAGTTYYRQPVGVMCDLTPHRPDPTI